MNIQNVTVVGLQWGDEGKGKVVDALARTSDYVVRFCGGANAGHSVMVGEERYALHLIPCGILHPGVLNVIGNGVVFDPATAMTEIQGLRKRGMNIGPDQLRISEAAQVVMPWHKYQDTLSEAGLGQKKIGTTARGIGPCYADKANRSTAIRAADLTDAAILREKIRTIGEIKNRLFAEFYQTEPMDIAAIEAEYLELAEALAPLVCNTGATLRRACKEGQRVLFEGGQGSMLDVDHGTYPFVTSSSVTACGVPSGAGVSPKSVGHVVGIAKAYTTRVGAGPFATEQDNAVGEQIRRQGHEFGTTTGRPRRCGWLDTALLQYTAELSGVDEIALMLLDVLTGIDELQICTAYTRDGKPVEDFNPADMENLEPVYETLPGWREDITACKSFDELPTPAQNYVKRVSELIGRPVGIVSVGPERTQTLNHNSALDIFE